MEISITRDHQLISNYDISLKNTINKSYSNLKHKKLMVLALSMFNIKELQKGNLILSSMFNGSSDIRYIFSHSFFGFDFSIGAIIIVGLVVSALFILAPHIGEWLQGNEIGNWIVGIIGVIAIIIIFLI